MTDSASDRASLLVVEGLVMAMLVLGSILYVVHVGESGSSPTVPRGSLRAVAQDALNVLADRPACLDFTEPAARLDCWHTYGAGMLGRHVTDALQGNPGPFASKVSQLLPPGARFNLYLDNGRGAIPLRAVDPPGSETVSVGVTFAPALNLAFVAPDFNCFDPSVPLRVHALPVFGASVALASAGTRQVSFSNGYVATLPSGGQSPIASTFLPAAGASANGYPKAGNEVFESAFVYNTMKLRGGHAFNASATDCPLGAVAFADARRGLNLSALEIGAADGAGGLAPTRAFTIGDRALVRFDFAPYLAEVDEEGAFTARVRVFDPVPPAMGGVAYRERFHAVFDVSAATAEVPIGNDALYGPSLVCAEASTTIEGAGGVKRLMTARKCDYLVVDLEPGASAFAPTYRVVLEAWFPEWER